jgi:hypothetical protein
MSATASKAGHVQVGAAATASVFDTRRAERRTWLLLTSAFLIWCAIAVSTVVYATNYRRSATDSPPAMLSVDRGTVFYQGVSSPSQVRAHPGMSVEEGGFVEAGDNGQATLEMFDGSIVKLMPHSRLELGMLRVGKFNSDHTRLSLNLINGSANLNVTGRLPFGREVTVATPHGVVSLTKGDYLVWVQEDGTRVSSYTGQAKVDVDGRVKRLRDGQRALIPVGGAPQGPYDLLENLIKNGNFAGQLQGWTMLDSGEQGRPDVGGTRRMVEDMIAGRKVQALQISRETTKDTHNETGIVQEINRDVSAYRNVSFTAWIKINSASLSGGGYLGSEYPIMFRVNYTDEKGGKPGWSHGFYYANPDNRPTPAGELIAQGEWYPYLGRLSDLPDRPAYIRSIEVLAAGHDFDAIVTDIRLIAE